MKLLFIIGTGRCGSTLVHEVLSRHDGMGFVSNIEDNLPFFNQLGRWNNMLYRTWLGGFTRKGSIRFAPSEAYKLISREVSPLYADPCRDLTEKDVTPWLKARFQRFFKVRALAQGRPVFSHKYTGWSRLRFFTAVFPDARFIHVVRDGRAVANSWLQMPWWGGHRGPENSLWGPLPPVYQAEWETSGRSFVRLAAIQWKVLMDAFDVAEPAVPPDQYLRIRYEDILADSSEHFAAMLRFAGLQWSKVFERQFSRTTFITDRSHAYRKDLSPEQLREVEESLAGHLNRYGYR